MAAASLGDPGRLNGLVGRWANKRSRQRRASFPPVRIVLYCT